MQILLTAPCEQKGQGNRKNIPGRWVELPGLMIPGSFSHLMVTGVVTDPLLLEGTEVEVYWSKHGG